MFNRQSRSKSQLLFHNYIFFKNNFFLKSIKFLTLLLQLKQDIEYEKKLMEKLHGPSPLDPYLVRTNSHMVISNVMNSFSYNRG